MIETEPRWSCEFLPFLRGGRVVAVALAVVSLRLDLAGLQRAVALDVGDEQRLAVGRQPHRAGIPAGRDQPDDAARVGSPSRAGRPPSTPSGRRRRSCWCRWRRTGCRAVGTQGDGVGAAAERQLRLRLAVDRLDHLVRRRVDDGDGVAVGVGDVDELAVRARGHAARMPADRDRLRLLPPRRPSLDTTETLPWFATLVRGSVSPACRRS